MPPPQSNNFIPFSRPSIGTEEEEAVLRVMRSGWLTTGAETLAFEKEFADFVGSPFASAVNSASNGLMLAMEACGITGDTKILTTPYTFVSTATSARHLNAEVVYADIEQDTYNIDPAEIEKKLKEDRTIKAVVPVHVAGNICRMEEIKEIARKYTVYIIEDAAHAFPSPTNMGYAGTIGDIGVYSFYATKTITTAEGGMVCTGNEKIAARIRLMGMHGIDRPVWDRYTSDKASWEYDVTDAGFKCNLPDILSAIGREQLKKADIFYRKRKSIAEAYNKAFREYDFFTLPPDAPGNAWHLYLLRIVPEKLTCSRNDFASALQKRGLGISVHFIPHFRMTYFKNRYNLHKESFPHAQRQFETTVSLPFWPDMTEETVYRVIDTVINTGKEYYAS